MTSVLGIEDNDAKWSRIEALIRANIHPVEIVRANDVYTGERKVEDPGWDLLILDISLDIRAGAGRAGRGSHDYTGGLKIASRMFYLECEIPTIIVTGFDAFPTGAATAEDNVILGLEDVRRQARKMLGDNLLGAVRFGSPGWDDDFLTILKKFSDK